jgi:leader peptidase (prepilin peptidase) / N-methyltransferase
VNIYDTIVQVALFWLGAAIGSFLNVIVYRVPAGLSVIWPPSRCPKCLHQLGMGENIPILGWLLLRGKCRHCRTQISIRYPLVELATAIIFAIVYNRFGISIQTVGYSLLMCWLLALTLIDLDTMTLPNSLTQSALILGLVFQVIAGYLDNHSFLSSKEYFIQGIVGMVLGIWIYDTIQLVGSLMVGQSAQGGGDAKLMAAIGAWFNWKFVLLSGAAASILALIGFLITAGRSTILGGGIKGGSNQLLQRQPLGPFIALGATIILFAEDWLIDAYLQFSRSPYRDPCSILLLIILLILLFWTRSMRLRSSRS